MGWVRGHWRRNGAYVNGHYRRSPRRRTYYYSYASSPKPSSINDTTNAYVGEEDPLGSFLNSLTVLLAGISCIFAIIIMVHALIAPSNHFTETLAIVGVVAFITNIAFVLLSIYLLKPEVEPSTPLVVGWVSLFVLTVTTTGGFLIYSYNTRQERTETQVQHEQEIKAQELKQKTYQNKISQKLLELGDNRSTVKEMFGLPDKTTGQKQQEIWRYSFERRNSYSLNIQFIDDKVIGLSDKRKTTPNYLLSQEIVREAQKAMDIYSQLKIDIIESNIIDHTKVVSVVNSNNLFLLCDPEILSPELIELRNHLLATQKYWKQATNNAMSKNPNLPKHQLGLGTTSRTTEETSNKQSIEQTTATKAAIQETTEAENIYIKTPRLLIGTTWGLKGTHNPHTYEVKFLDGNLMAMTQLDGKLREEQQRFKWQQSRNKIYLTEINGNAKYEGVIKNSKSMEGSCTTCNLVFWHADKSFN